jgi:hypothetical protein
MNQRCEHVDVGGPPCPNTATHRAYTAKKGGAQRGQWVFVVCFGHSNHPRYRSALLMRGASAPKPECEHRSDGVPCVHPATWKQKHGVGVLLCGWHRKLTRYQPVEPLETKKADARDFVVVSSELYEKLEAFAKVADASVAQVADHFVRKALDQQAPQGKYAVDAVFAEASP